MPKASLVGVHAVQLCRALRLEDFPFVLSPTEYGAQSRLSLSARRADVFSPREKGGWTAWAQRVLAGCCYLLSQARHFSNAKVLTLLSTGCALPAESGRSPQSEP